MPAQRLPWFKFWPEALEHEKIAALTDSERWTWVVVLSKASQQPKRWRFASVEHAAHVTGRPVKHIRRLLDVRLLDLEDGLIVHNARRWQDASNITPSQREGVSNGVATPPEPPPNTNGKVTHHPAKGDARVTERPSNSGLDTEGDRDKDEDVEKDATPLFIPPRGKRAKPAHEALAEDEERALLDKWAPIYGSDQDVSDEIAAALNHNARLKCKSERLYVDTWLRNNWRRSHPGKPMPLLSEVPRREVVIYEPPPPIRQLPCETCGEPASESIWDRTDHRCMTCYRKRKAMA